METAAKWIRGFGMMTSLDALAELVRTERACAVADWQSAERHSLASISLATQAEHEQFARIGFMMTRRVLAAQGKHSEALRMLQAMTVREQNVRAEALDERVLPARMPAGGLDVVDDTTEEV